MDFDSDEVSQYERMRIANIQRNAEFLNKIGLETAKEGMKPIAQHKASIKGRTPRIRTSVLPTRRSGRVTIDKVKTELEKAKGDGNMELVALKEAELADMTLKKTYGSYETTLQQESMATVYARIPEEPLSMLLPHNIAKALQKQANSNGNNYGNINSNNSSSTGNSENPVLDDINYSEDIVKLIISNFVEMVQLQHHQKHNVSSFSSANGGGNAVTASPRRKRGSDKEENNTPIAVVSAIPSIACNITQLEHEYRALSLKEADVAKITEERITATTILPAAHVYDKLVVVAGDKEGYVGIWDVDCASSARYSEYDGIYKYKPHISNICNIHCNYNSILDQKIYTTSYDGTIRYLDICHQSFNLLFQTPEDIYDVRTTDVNFSPFADNIIFIGRNDGKVGLVDTRVGSINNSSNSSSSASYTSTYQWLKDFQDVKINSIQQHPINEYILVAAGSSADGYISVHDTRKLGGSASNGCMFLINEHSRSINAATISPNGKYLVSVSQDNSVKVWKDFLSYANSSSKSSNAKHTSSNMKANASIKHDNITGRWLSTFKPTFDMKYTGNVMTEYRSRYGSISHSATTIEGVFVMGSMDHPRKMEVFAITNGSNGSHENSKDDENNASGSPKKAKKDNTRVTTSNSVDYNSCNSEGVNVQCIRNIRSEHLNSVCSRNAVHDLLNVVAGGNSSGRLHVFR